MSGPPSVNKYGPRSKKRLRPSSPSRVQSTMGADRIKGLIFRAIHKANQSRDLRPLIPGIDCLNPRVKNSGVFSG
ncbi:hypothetical protein EYF80_011795 [Liparis tanakae]|uniref:Uncharacterized protein n=1 Tax=Liparis tanakae TaxID=230148 RepID=A0A4Z2IJV2_9TELE|nr:hypothetical protein EYF80_011795 [Liparis tanakae]